MKLHYLQHVPFEGIAGIGGWALRKGFSVSSTQLYKEFKLPCQNDFDWLAVMGGPMNIYEEGKFPWLKQEKNFIRHAVDKGKVVLGVCLGAQLVAAVLGGEVKKNNHKEIGWYPVNLTEEGAKEALFKNFPPEFTPFHWHGDTFEVPAGAIRIAESQACKNQAFIYKDRVLGLQFHLESSLNDIENLIKNCGSELVEAKFIQSKGKIISLAASYIKGANSLLNCLLDGFLRQSA